MADQEDPDNKKPPLEAKDPGYLVMRMKAGDSIQVGPGTEVSVREVKNGNVKVAVKAPRTVSIKRIP